jgi:predicted DCC family thiol-disulfide oxidoreductase YuxK
VIAEADVRRGELCIDARCGFCLRLGFVLRRWLRRRGFRLRGLQAPDVARRLGLAPGEVGDQFMLIHADGRAVGGAAAVRDVLRAAVGPLAAPLDLALALRCLDRAYRWAARRYHCRDGRCPRRAVPGGHVRSLAEAMRTGLLARRRPGAL